MRKIAIVVLVVAAALTTLAQELQRPSSRRPSLPPRGGQAAPARSEVSADGSGLNFNGSVDELLFLYGSLVGKTILKDPQVKGDNITFRTEEKQKLTTEEQIEALEVVLEMNGVHVEKYGEKFVRAIPRKAARKEGIPLILDSNAELKESVNVVSLMLPFKNISVEDAQKALDNFKSETGIIIGFERNNSLLLTDTEQNINRMREIAREIDIASPVTEVVEYIQIKNASAQEVKTVLDSIVQESQKEQEKSGNAPVNRGAQNNQSSRPSLLGRRPGQPQQNAPASNASVLMTVSDADRGMIRGKVVTIADERSNKILIITSASNMKFFKEVIAALDVETTPDTVVKVYRLKYADAEDVSDMINDLIGNSSTSKNSGKSNQNQNAKNGSSGNATRGTQTAARKAPANQRSGETKAGELSKDNTTVLADKRINGLVVMTNKELVPTIEQIIESMDIKLSQVLIETVIIEVTLGDGIEAGVDWVSRGRAQTTTRLQNSAGQNMSYVKRTTTYTGGTKAGTSYSEVLKDKVVTSDSGYTTSENIYDTDGETVIGTITESVCDEDGIFPTIAQTVSDGLVNYYTGGTYSMGGGSSGGTAAAASLATDVITNFAGSGFNYIWKSDQLNLAAVLHATKIDSRSKYIASPVIMTLDNKEATIEATETRKFYSGSTGNSSGYSNTTTYNYSDKDIGIKIKVTPKINPNGTVMLEVEEEYSQLGAGQSVLVGGSGGGASKENIDTAVTRKMSADALLENNQTVLFAGLTSTYTQEEESGIPILKDIPYIGKWLFGSVSSDETRSELLVFMTPYVLDDAQAAEAEALRRKKAISDPRPWDDHGWSASKLADPVARKELMRRIKDEWKKQDEDRRAKRDIEKAKMERAKELQAMTEEDRNRWLNMHKEELEKEKQEELEKKMQDKNSQEELKKLAEKIKADKMAAAEKELKKAEDETAASNERAKLDAEKAKKAAEKKGQE